MNIRVVLNVLGALLFFLGLTYILPICFTLYYHDQDLFALTLSGSITIFLGLILHLTNRKFSDIRAREGIAIVSLGWIVSAAAGAMPFCFYSPDFSFTDAFFEVMSGFTTTGASILSNIEALPHGLLFWRSLTHWLGGMGIIVMSLAILPMVGVGGMQLFKAEVPGPSHDKIRPRIQETAKILWGVYLLLTGIQTILLCLGGMTLFDSLCHTFGTMATGGFSTKNISMGAYPSAYLQSIVTIFMILAGTNFALHYRALLGKFNSYLGDGELRFYLWITFVSTVIIFINLYFETGLDWGRSLLDSSFQVASILTTTGFASVDYEKWPVFSQAVLLVLMFIGGCAGSTGGGIKVIRVLVLCKYALAELKRLVHPNAVIPVRLGGKSLSSDVVIRILGFTALYFFLLVVVSLLLASMGIDLGTAVSAAVATLGNIGPGFASIGPTENFGAFPVAAKWLLSFCMLLGRLELFTVLVFFSREFWKN